MRAELKQNDMQLALLGGAPALRREPPSWPYFDERDQRAGRASTWVDLVTENQIETTTKVRSLKVKIPAQGFRALEFRLIRD